MFYLQKYDDNYKGKDMFVDINPYREIDADITAEEFELFCLNTLQAYAEREKLQNFIIKHNQKLKSEDGTYQIDIYIEYTVLGTQNIILVECKKHSNSIKRDIVANLYSKLQSLGAQKGIIISTAGFQSGAVQYAEKHGIALWQVCNNYVKHICASADKRISDIMKLQLEVDRYLPKYFALEWDCSADYPYTQIYPTEKMQQDARNKALDFLNKNNINPDTY